MLYLPSSWEYALSSEFQTRSILLLEWLDDKRRILEAADRCTQPGEIGALLRKEGIYSSHLTTWRRQRAADERAALAPQKRGRKADPAQTEDRRVLQLTQENDRLRRKLAQANAIIDVQKKLCALLGLSTDETPSECC